MGIRIEPCEWSESILQSRSNFNLLVGYRKTMVDTFLEHMLRHMRWDPFRKIRGYIIGMIPEPVRKIVGLILLIFGAVALLRFYPGMLFYMMSDLMSMITLFVGISSIALGRMFLRHKG